MQLHFGVEAPLLHESRLTGSVAKRFQKSGQESAGWGNREGSRIANAVRVAGPDRISFFNAVVGSFVFGRWSHPPCGPGSSLNLFLNFAFCSPMLLVGLLSGWQEQL
jgi:hypothetical protein